MLLNSDASRSFRRGCTLFGSSSKVLVQSEKAVAANVSAVREWDANGTVFGYNPKHNHLAGEFGHNDYYPVVIAACQQKGKLCNLLIILIIGCFPMIVAMLTFILFDRRNVS